MTEVAGEVADGLLAHGFTTARYMREVTLPALDRGLARSGRTRADYEISYPAMMVTGTNEAEMQAATQAVKAQLAFYASTPAYRPVLDLHGWGDLHSELNTLSKRGEWVADGGTHPRRHARRLRRVRGDQRDPGQGRRALRGHGRHGSASTPPTAWTTTASRSCWPGFEGVRDTPCRAALERPSVRQVTKLTSRGGRATTRDGSAPPSASDHTLRRQRPAARRPLR